MIPRRIAEPLAALRTQYPVITMTEPRQSGKTTVCRSVFGEFQRAPTITSYLQGIVDEPGFSGTFVLTGSTNLLVRDTVHQSLAGRTTVVELLPLSQSELWGRRIAAYRTRMDLTPRGQLHSISPTSLARKCVQATG